MASDVVAEVAAAFPGRTVQIAELARLLGEGGVPACPALYVYGRSATGKTAVVTALLAALAARGGVAFAHVDCIECFTPRLLFERALDQLTGTVPQARTDWTTFARCDAPADFFRHLRRLEATPPVTRYIVFDRAERLRDLGPTVLPALLRLQELSGTNVGAIFISTVVWEKCRPPAGAPEPLLVHFPDYPKPAVMEILARDMPPDEPDRPFFLSFVDLLYSVFHGPCRDLNELRHAAALLFPKYREPVLRGQVSKSDTVRLFRHIDPYLRQTLDKLYLRQLSASEWTRQQQQAPATGAAAGAPVPAVAGMGVHVLDLPHYSKFLLLASFLASYNPAGMDLRYFSHAAQPRARPRRRGVGRGRGGRGRGASSGAAAAAAAAKLRTQLLGPRTFPVDRMLAIFHHIVDEPVEPTVDLHEQIGTLVSLKLLVQVSAPDRLEGMTYRCGLRYDDAQRLARSVGFALSSYLYDFAG